MKNGSVAFLLLTLLLFGSFVAYDRVGFAPANPASSVPPEWVIVGDVSDFPERCDPIQMTHIILNFFEAYNNGQEERFVEIFPPNFTWYTDGDPEMDWLFLTTSRKELIPYFAERHRQHERLSLIALHLVGPDNMRPDLINMSYSLHRQADDLELGPDGISRLGGGKGAMLCSQKKIYVWSMGIEPRNDTTPMWSSECKDLNEFTPPDGVPSVIVCVGES